MSLTSAVGRSASNSALIKMPIQLIPAGEETTVEIEAVPKRGRGRPLGSKNRPKPITPEPPLETEETESPPPEPVPEATPEVTPEVTPEATPPEPEEAVAKAAPKRKRRESAAPPPPPEPEPKRRGRPKARAEAPAARAPTPESPRTAKQRAWREYREANAVAHAQRRDHYSSMLSRFML